MGCLGCGSGTPLPDHAPAGAPLGHPGRARRRATGQEFSATGGVPGRGTPERGCGAYWAAWVRNMAA